MVSVVERTRKQTSFKNQSGAVLIVALVLLLVLTVLGTSGIQDTLITERMTGNFRDTSVAFESAESSLRVLEEIISDTGFDFDASVTSGDLNGYNVTDSTISVVPVGWAVNPYASVSLLSVSVALPDVISGQPEYYVERLPPVSIPGGSLVLGFQDTALDLVFYRVTSKGFGVSPNAEVVLQSTFFRGPE
jgi:type IV pilus assembly protein PilX